MDKLILDIVDTKVTDYFTSNSSDFKNVINDKIYFPENEEKFPLSNNSIETQDLEGNNSSSVKTDEKLLLQKKNKVLDLQRINTKKELLRIIAEDTVIPGYYSRAEIYFREKITENKDLAFNVLNEIYIDNVDNNNVLLALVQLVSNYDYDYIFPIGQTIALLSAYSGDGVLCEFALRAYEGWGNVKSLDQLKKLATIIKIDWLEEYRLEIIEDLEGELKKSELLSS